MRGAFLPGLMTMRGYYQDKMKALYGVGVDTIFFGFTYLDDNITFYNPRVPFGIAGWWKPWLVVDASGPDSAIPIWDLSVRNPDFTASLTDKLQVMRDIAKAKGDDPQLSPCYIFDDRCSEAAEGGWQQLLDPYYSNTLAYKDWQHPEQQVEIKNGYKSLRRDVTGGNQSTTFTPYRETLEHEVFELGKKLGFKVQYAVVKNEYGYEFGLSYEKKDGIKWLRDRSEHLRHCGFVVVGSWSREITAEDCEPFSDLLDQHQIITPQDLAAAPALRWPAKVIVNTDGKSGAGSPASAYGGRTISEDQARGLGADMMARGLKNWAITPQEMWDSQSSETNAEPIRTEPFEAMSKATGWTPKPPEPPPVEYVTLNICTFTNLIANEFCPAKVETKFVKGTEPNEACKYHKGPQPVPPPRSWF